MSFDFDVVIKNDRGYCKYDYFDWYDYDKVEKLNQKRSKEWIKLYSKLREAKKNGDEKTFTKMRESLKKHETESKILKKKTEEAGHYWF
ncbi:MAG: hypothetical protein WCF65_09625 [Parachlamydiaceae bacterium]